MIIDRFRCAGVAVALLSFSHPDMIDHPLPDHRLQDKKAEALAYHQLLLALADEFGLPIVEFIFEDIWWNEELMFDSVHPNGRGYLLMEGNVVRGLHGLLVPNDLYSE